MKENIGLYVHIPFCIKKCNYCDFCSSSASEEQRKAYLCALENEMTEYKEQGISVDSIFFGGGTPSLLSADEFSGLCEAMHKSFKILPGAEFTVEANPKTVTPEKLLAYKRAGVNRLSIGMQSIHENELKTLGRIHNHSEFIESYSMAKDAGINNINVDVMYGIPHQTKESFSKTLSELVKISPEHISCYGLIIEEGTPFFEAKDSLPLPTEDDECDMYYHASEVLSSSGYSHYEISNYAKPGYECRHNLKYWRDEEYLGLGLAAHSYYGGKRFSNSCRNDEYYADSRAKYRRKERDTVGKNAFEYAMLRLRLKEGVCHSEYERLFSSPFAKGKQALLDEYEKAGLLITAGGRTALTEKGFYLSNTIISTLIDT